MEAISQHKRADLPPVEISSDGYSSRSTSNPASPLDSARKKEKNSKLTSFFKGLFVTKGGEGEETAQQQQVVSTSDYASGLQHSSHPARPGSSQDSAAAHGIPSQSPRLSASKLGPGSPSKLAPSPPVAMPPSTPKAGAAQSPRPVSQSPVPRVVPAPVDKSNITMLAVAPVLPPKMARPVWCLKDYAIVEKMYTGYASTVYKAWCKASGETVCLKAYNMSNLCELNRFQIYREVKLHSSLRHENIIALYAAFQQGDQVVLVQEYADSGDLFLMLHRYGGKLPEKTAVDMILAPFLNVLNYLHQNCIVHRDIKPENVLFSRTMQLKLCDFGLAIDLREERAVTRAGTLEYMAPEVLDCPFKNKPEENKEKTHLHYDLTVDTWAVGVLTYELLVGFPPFNDKQKAAIEDKIRSETPRFPSSMSEPARNFVLKALQKDALERPTISELLSHSWIRAHRKQAQRLHAQQQGLVMEEEPSTPPSADPLVRLQNKMFQKIAQTPPSEMRTQDGDLLRAMPSYLSFTAGSNRPKLPQLLHDPQPPHKADAKHAAPGHSALRPTGAEGVHPAAVVAPIMPKAPLKDKRFAGLDMGVGQSAMSFTSSQNPRLQILRGLAKGDHL